MKVYHVSDGRWRSMVAAKDQKEAARLLGTTVGQIRLYGGTLTDERDTGVALADPGRVFRRLIHHSRNRAWIPVDRTEKEAPDA